MKYECPRCGYNCDTIQSIKTHLAIKIMCKSIISDTIPNIENIIITKNDIICSFCNNEFSNKYSLKRHLAKCEIKINNEKEKELADKVELLVEEHIKKLHLKNQGNTINHINTNSNNTNNTNINMNMVLNYKDEKNTEFFDDNIYKSYSKLGVSRIPTLIENVHFDPEKPENHNMYISDITSDYAHKFDKGKWCTVLKNVFLEEVINKYERKIDYWETDPVNLVLYKGIKDSCDTYNKIIEEKGVFDEVMKKVALLLYNNKDMVIKTSKKCGIKLK